MAIDIKAELERQLGTLEDKLAKLQAELESKTTALRVEIEDLETEKTQVANTIGFLTGKITLPSKKGKKAVARSTGTSTGKSSLFKRRFILAKFYKAPVGLEKTALQKELDANKAAALKEGKTEAEISEHDKKYQPSKK